MRNRDEGPDLVTLARRAGWSRFYLQRAFSKTVGESPRRYVQRLRLEKAAAGLVSQSHSILLIALDAGFTSHEVFIRAFRRHFGCSPSAYRARALRGMSKRDRERHASSIASAGPCIRLFHTSLQPRPRNSVMPTSTVERKEVQAQPILFIQRKVKNTKMQPVLAECFGKLYGHGMQAGLAIAGNPMTRYVTTGQGLWTIDCIMPLLQPAEAPAGGEIQAGKLSAGPVAFAVHNGPYEQLINTYVTIEKWVEENGLKPGGPAWESYVTDPGDYPDPKDWRTEVFWPIA